MSGSVGKTNGEELRDYQKRAVKAAFREWKSVRSTLYVCPTGGGKSRVFTEIARRFKPQGRTLILADRDSLVMQAQENILKNTTLTTGIEKAHQHVDVSDLPDVVCATIQSIRQPKRLKRFPKDAFSLVVVDEADLAVAPSYAGVLARFPGAKVFGCTATPDRHDGQSIGSVFESVCAQETLPGMIRDGWLSRILRESIKIESVSLDKVPTRRGDFSEKALGRILTQERPLHEVVKPTLDLSGSRPTIVFSATVAHAQALAELFNRYRPASARAIHGGMSTGERDATMADFKAGKFQFLCNCVLLLRGVDVPFVSCISMARPMKSRALYCQALGRGTRLKPDNGDLLVVDFTDNSDTHSLIGVVDIVGEDQPPEVIICTGEILDKDPGKDVSSAIDDAIEQLKRDPDMLARVKAAVAFRSTPISIHGLVDWDTQPLGKMPDATLAGLLACSAPAVQKARETRRIPAFNNRNHIDWNRQPLGKMPDSELAKMLGCTKGSVRAARANRGIAASWEIDWDEQPLGEMPDVCIADLLGATASCVGCARRTRSIPVFHVSREPVEWDAQPLGVRPDREIAAKCGVTADAVFAARKVRGIKPAPREPRVLWSIQPLGRATDKEIADAVGVDPSSVLHARRARGIPAYRPQRRTA